jgi:hypothetical protein
MRLALLAAIPAVALTLLGGASAAKPVRVPSYCSKSGDVCYWIVEAGASHNLRLTLAAKYFSRYRICVRPQRRAATCKSFPVKKAGAQWGGIVNWQRNFPYEPGRYQVTWRRGLKRLGPPLNFTLQPERSRAKRCQRGCRPPHLLLVWAQQH